MSDHNYKIAKHWKPVIYQEWKRNFDFLSPINFGKFIVPETSADVHIYYHVKEDDNYYYILYCFYHYKDWSELPPPLTSLDEHRHDFEGCMLVVGKKKGLLKLKIARSHYDLFFKRHNPLNVMNKNIFIEPAGHAVHPAPTEDFLNSQFNIMQYHDYTLVPMDLDTKEWKDIGIRFVEHGVTLPDKWNDRRIRRHYGAKTDGLIYNDPAELIRLAKKMNMIE